MKTISKRQTDVEESNFLHKSTFKIDEKAKKREYKDQVTQKRKLRSNGNIKNNEK